MTDTTRANDFMQILVNLQQDAQAKGPAKSPYFFAGIESVACLDSVAILSPAGPPYYVGTGAIGTNTGYVGYCEVG